MELKAGIILTAPSVNNSSCSHPRFNSYNFIMHIGLSETIEALLILFLTLSIILANALVLLVINNRRYAPHIHQQPRYLITSLALNDLAIGFLITPFGLLPALFHCWPYGEIFCQIQALLRGALAQQSAVILVCMAVDRYIWALHPRRYCQHSSKKGCVAILSCTWIISLTVFGMLVLPKGYYFNITGLMACEPFYSKPSYRILATCALYFPTTMVLMYCYGSSFHMSNFRLNDPVMPMPMMPHQHQHHQHQHQHQHQQQHHQQHHQHHQQQHPQYHTQQQQQQQHHQQQQHAAIFSQPHTHSYHNHNLITTPPAHAQTTAAAQHQQQQQQQQQQSSSSSVMNFNMAMGMSLSGPMNAMTTKKIVPIQKHSSNNNTSRSMAAISLGFIVMVTPWTIQEIVTACTGSKLPPFLDFLVTWLALSNSFWNPFMYWLLNADFRRLCRDLIPSRCTWAEDTPEHKVSCCHMDPDFEIGTLPMPPAPPTSRPPLTSAGEVALCGDASTTPLPNSSYQDICTHVTRNSINRGSVLHLAAPHQPRCDLSAALDDLPDKCWGSELLERTMSSGSLQRHYSHRAHHHAHHQSFYQRKPAHSDRTTSPIKEHELTNDVACQKDEDDTALSKHSNSEPKLCVRTHQP